MTTRQQALNATKTIFGLATCRIRHESGERVAAANGISVFQALPDLVIDGYFGKPPDDMTTRGDFNLLMEHVTDEDPMEYVSRLDDGEVEKIADSAESFFIDFVKAEDVIPVSDEDKRSIIRTLSTT